MRISVKTKSDVNLVGELSTISKYIVSLKVQEIEPCVANVLSHVDNADIQIFRDNVGVIIDMDRVEFYTIY